MKQISAQAGRRRRRLSGRRGVGRKRRRGNRRGVWMIVTGERKGTILEEGVNLPRIQMTVKVKTTTSSSSPTPMRTIETKIWTQVTSFLSLTSSRSRRASSRSPMRPSSSLNPRRCQAASYPSLIYSQFQNPSRCRTVCYRRPICSHVVEAEAEYNGKGMEWRMWPWPMMTRCSRT